MGQLRTSQRTDPAPYTSFSLLYKFAGVGVARLACSFVAEPTRLARLLPGPVTEGVVPLLRHSALGGALFTTELTQIARFAFGKADDIRKCARVARQLVGSVGEARHQTRGACGMGGEMSGPVLYFIKVGPLYFYKYKGGFSRFGKYKGQNIKVV